MPDATPPAPDAPRAERRALLWAMGAILLWSSFAAVSGDALAGLPATTLLLWSLTFAAPALVLIDLGRGRALREIVVAPPGVLALGLWGIFGYHAMFFVALERAPIVQANLLNFLWPLFMVLLAPLVTDARWSWPVLGGALVGFLGAALVVTQGERLHLEARHALGYALAAGAGVTWAGFSLGLRRLGPRGEGRMPAFVLVSLLPALALALATGTAAPPGGRALAAAAWLGVGPMAVAFQCWDRALATGDAGRIGALSYVDPLLSTLCVVVVLGKPLSGASIAGMLLIVGGAATATFLGGREPAS